MPLGIVEGVKDKGDQMYAHTVYEKKRLIPGRSR